jgi:hypothetical protein
VVAGPTVCRGFKEHCCVYILRREHARGGNPCQYTRHNNQNILHELPIDLLRFNTKLCHNFSKKTCRILLPGERHRLLPCSAWFGKNSRVKTSFFPENHNASILVEENNDKRAWLSLWIGDTNATATRRSCVCLQVFDTLLYSNRMRVVGPRRLDIVQSARGEFSLSSPVDD